MRTAMISGPAFRELLEAVDVDGSVKSITVGNINIINKDHTVRFEVKDLLVEHYDNVGHFNITTRGGCSLTKAEAEALHQFLGTRLGIEAQKVQPLFAEGERVFFKPNKVQLRITRISTLHYTLEGGIIAGPTELERIA